METKPASHRTTTPRSNASLRAGARAAFALPPGRLGRVTVVLLGAGTTVALAAGAPAAPPTPRGGIA